MKKKQIKQFVNKKYITNRYLKKKLYKKENSKNNHTAWKQSTSTAMSSQCLSFVHFNNKMSFGQTLFSQNYPDDDPLGEKLG